VIGAIIKAIQTGLSWAFAGWKKKNDPSVPQREDQINKAYDAKRRDLEKR
jgi:hypothetical protein